MGDVAQILGAKPGSGNAGGEEPIFKLRAAPEKKGGAGASKIAVGAGAKKKKKLSRELSALVGDNVEEVLPPVAPSRALPIYAGLKARPGANRSKRWAWRPFTSSARPDGMQLSHWVRTDAEFPDYPFARFNKKVDIIRYTSQEYDALLTPSYKTMQASMERVAKSGSPDNASNPHVVTDVDARWPREHTDMLFDLCRKFDLRWPLIYDRFEARPPHSLEDMKYRFYTVTARVIAARLRDTNEQVRASVHPLMAYHEYCYRMEWEAKRRKQLDHVFRRLPEHLRLERELVRELKNVQLAIKKANARASAAGAGAIVLGKIPVAALAAHAQQEKEKAKMAVAAQHRREEQGEDGADTEAEKEAGAAGSSSSSSSSSIAVLPPLHPQAIPLTLHNLSVKRRDPYQLGVGAVQPDGSAAVPLPLTVEATQAAINVHLQQQQTGALPGPGQPIVRQMNKQQSQQQQPPQPDGSPSMPGYVMTLPSRDPSKDADPFKGVALRSSQVRAALEGYQPDSSSMKRIALFLRDQYGVDEARLLPSVQVFAEHRQLKREADALLQLAATVEQEEVKVHRLYALRRETGLRPLATAPDDVTARMLEVQQLRQQQQQQQQQQQLQQEQYAHQQMVQPIHLHPQHMVYGGGAAAASAGSNTGRRGGGGGGVAMEQQQHQHPMQAAGQKRRAAEAGLPSAEEQLHSHRGPSGR